MIDAEGAVVKNLIFFAYISVLLILSISCASGKVKKSAAVDQNSAYSQYGDQGELKEFLVNFTVAVEKGDWSAVLSFFDRDNYLGQVSIGVEKNQYIIEGMNLPMSEFSAGGGSADLSRLRSLVVNDISYAVDDRYAEVRGDAVLRNGRRIPFVLLIIRYLDGKFAIAPPVG